MEEQNSPASSPDTDSSTATEIASQKPASRLETAVANKDFIIDQSLENVRLEVRGPDFAIIHEDGSELTVLMGGILTATGQPIRFKFADGKVLNGDEFLAKANHHKNVDVQHVAQHQPESVPEPENELEEYPDRPETNTQQQPVQESAQELPDLAQQPEAASESEFNKNFAEEIGKLKENVQGSGRDDLSEFQKLLDNEFNKLEQITIQDVQDTPESSDNTPVNPDTTPSIPEVELPEVTTTAGVGPGSGVGFDFTVSLTNYQAVTSETTTGYHIGGGGSAESVTNSDYAVQLDKEAISYPNSDQISGFDGITVTGDNATYFTTSTISRVLSINSGGQATDVQGVIIYSLPDGWTIENGVFNETNQTWSVGTTSFTITHPTNIQQGISTFELRFEVSFIEEANKQPEVFLVPAYVTEGKVPNDLQGEVNGQSALVFNLLHNGDVIDLGAGDDVVDASVGDDIIHTGAGNDTIKGGPGADTIDGGTGTDTLDYSGSVAGTITSGVTVNLKEGKATDGYGGQDTEIKNIEIVKGSALVDQLTGSDNNDELYGQDGNDTLNGEGGNDKLYGGNGDDTLNGGSGADELYGNAGADTLNGGLGSDKLYGEAGSDTLNGDGGNDVLYGGAGQDTLYGGDDNDTLIGGDDNDQVYGDAGDDTFISGSGSDIYDGGTGKDKIDYSGYTAGPITANLQAGPEGFGYVTKNGSATSDKVKNIEDLVGTDNSDGDTLTGNDSANELSGGKGNDTLAGGAGADILNGGEGDDTLIGGAGADELNGGTGTDTADYSSQSDPITIFLKDSPITVQDGTGATDTLIDVEIIKGSLRNGNDTLDYSGTSDSVKVSLEDENEFINFENITGTDKGDELTGDKNANVLKGGIGNDQFWGNDGNDLLEGGAGDDIFYAGTGSDTFNGGVGTDTLKFSDATSAVTAVLSSSNSNGYARDESADADDTIIDIENLVGSIHGDTLTGNDDNNHLEGGQGDDTLSGGKGLDTLDGGEGNDQLFGGDGNDTLNGGLGDDTLAGGSGDDTLNGGDGRDIVDYSSQSAAITVGLNSGSATVGNDTLTGIEGIIGSSGNDTFYSDTAHNSFDGSAGVDHIDYSGSLVTGGVVANLSGKYARYTHDGQLYIDTLTNIENLTGTDSDDVLTGDASANIINGGDGSDRIDGGGGADKLYGGGGAYSYNTIVFSTVEVDISMTMTNHSDSDTRTFLIGNDEVTLANFQYAVGGSGNDTFTGTSDTNHLWGGKGNDTLNGEGGTDQLYGEEGDDLLYGGDGNFTDHLYGGAGNDTLWGGAGTDHFYGGDGLDTVSFSDHTSDTSTGGIKLDMTYPHASYKILNNGKGAAEHMFDIEAVEGSQYADDMTGVAGFKMLGAKGEDALKIDFTELDKSTTNPTHLDGGEGNDTLHIKSASGSFNLADYNNLIIKNIETIDLTNGTENDLTLTINLGDIVGMAGANKLTVKVDKSDSDSDNVTVKDSNGGVIDGSIQQDGGVLFVESSNELTVYYV